MKFHDRNWFIGLMLIFITPLGIYLMWKNNKFGKVTRSILTGMFSFWFLIICIGAFTDSPQTSTNLESNKSIATAKNEVKDTKESEVTKEANNTENVDKNKETTKAQSNSVVKGQLKIHFINVGQADSILIQQGNNSMLIDAGNNADSETVKSYISNQGITQLDYVIGTHPHEDHIGGLDYVINSFKIGKIYMPKVTSNTKTFQDVVEAIKNKGMQITTPVPGTSFNLGEANCTIFAPNSGSYEDLNNYSIVIKIKFGNNSFMLDGDAEAISEMEMLNKEFDVKADVLKVGHHGSNSSTCSNFLNAVNPKYAVISVGNDNSYGHPHLGTMNRLKEKNILVYRTDECGTIICTSDGDNISFNTKPGDYSYRGNGTSANNSSTGDTTTKKADNAQVTTKQSEDNPLVYIVGNGKKYHSAGCTYLHGEGRAIPLKDAVNQGYTPCSKCSPPILH